MRRRCGPSAPLSTISDSSSATTLARRGPITTYIRRCRRRWRCTTPPTPLPRLRAHDLRHTAATLLLEEHVDIKYVSRQLRHSSTVITQNLYQHVTDRMAALPARTIDRMIETGKRAGEKS